jgi:hypothetical protein
MWVCIWFIEPNKPIGLFTKREDIHENSEAFTRQVFWDKIKFGIKIALCFLFE